MKEEYKLPHGFKVTALERIMDVGQAKLHFEGLKTQDMSFEELLQKCRDYAMRRRVEHGHKSKSADDMDIGNVDDSCGHEKEYNHDMNMGGGFVDAGNWDVQDINEFGKARGKGSKGKGPGWGKGAWGKGAGKAKGKGTDE